MSIYLDNNATTKIRDEVFESMLPYLKEEYGNPSSIYSLGERANRAVYLAREKVADLISSSPQEIVFTASGSESNNMAIRGALRLKPEKRNIVISSVEHPSVYKTVKELEDYGYKISLIPVNSLGQIDLDGLESKINDNTSLVSIMYANNETGIVFPIDEISRIVKKKNILLHVDAVQAPGKTRIDVKKSRIDFLSISAHKFHGPKGVGALFIGKGIDLPSLMIGGAQERRRRAGTENVAGIAGMGEASKLAALDIDEKADSICRMRDYLETSIEEKIPGVVINGKNSERVPNTTSISFSDIDASTLLMLLNEFNIFASLGSACMSGAHKPSRILTSMGVREKLAMSTVRFSLSRFTTEEEIGFVIDKLPSLIEKARVSG